MPAVHGLIASKKPAGSTAIARTGGLLRPLALRPLRIRRRRLVEQDLAMVGDGVAARGVALAAIGIGDETQSRAASHGSDDRWTGSRDGAKAGSAQVQARRRPASSASRAQR